MITGNPGVTRYPNAPRPDTEEAGEVFEDFICDQLAQTGIFIRTYKSRQNQYGRGESKAGWEIKLDEEHTKYGHLSIEVEERTQSSQGLIWSKSGIFRKDNTWLYIQGNTKMFWIFFKPALINYFNTKKPQVTPKFGTIKTFYLDYSEADKLGKRVNCNHD